MDRLPPTIRAHEKKLFWDVDPADLDPATHEDFIVGRVLSVGAWEDILALRAELGDDALRAFVIRAPHRLDRRSLRFFQVVFGVEPSRADSSGLPGPFNPPRQFEPYCRHMLGEGLRERDDSPVEDKIIVLHGASWADFQRVLEVRGDAPVPRLAYLEGELELTTPSRTHESLKSRVGRLIEVWCLEKDLEFSPVGSWTLEDKSANAGIEPDECYVFGLGEPVRPDLAIEVVWTSGGIKKLDIYQRLGVREVWFWRRGRLTAHVLRGQAYAEVSASEVLPGIDLEEIAGFLDRPIASQAIREYRAALRARR